MNGQNDVSQHGHRASMQGGKQGQGTTYLSPLRHGGEALAQANVRVQNYGINLTSPPNQAYDPDDELDETDSEFENDSELDDDYSEQEDEAIVHNNLQQNPHNLYNAPQTFSMPSQSATDTNYSAINALSQLSGSVAPTFNMLPSQSGQSVADTNYSIMNALSQLSAAAPNFNIPTQSHNAIALSQLNGTVHWQTAQPNSNGNRVNEHHGYNNGVKKVCDQNGNGDNESDDDEITDFDDNDSEIEDEKKKVVPKRVQNNYEHSTPNRIAPRPCNPIRPRIQPCRNYTGIDSFQIQRREFMGNITTAEEFASPSTVAVALKRFRKLFQRNKTSTNKLPELRDSFTSLPVCMQSNPELEEINRLQKLKSSEALLTPSDNASIWMNTEHDSEATPTGNNTLLPYEKSIQAFLFRSNFPDHFLGIRLLKLSVEEVQQIIRQVDLLENVQEILIEVIANEALSGPALMSCDLIQLRKALGLNLGHWTIFVQLIDGLRHIQTNELLNGAFKRR